MIQFRTLNICFFYEHEIILFYEHFMNVINMRTFLIYCNLKIGNQIELSKEFEIQLVKWS